MGCTIQAIVINGKDNVATALKLLHAGTKVSVGVQGRVQKVTLLSDIPMGHKFALKDMEKGAAVIKYGGAYRTEHGKNYSGGTCACP